jgi:hypothetical protein
MASFSGWFIPCLIPFGMSYCFRLLRYAASCIAISQWFRVYYHQSWFLFSWSSEVCSSVSASISTIVSCRYFTCQSLFLGLYDIIYISYNPQNKDWQQWSFGIVLMCVVCSCEWGESLFFRYCLVLSYSCCRDIFCFYPWVIVGVYFSTILGILFPPVPRWSRILYNS